MMWNRSLHKAEEVCVGGLVIALVIFSCDSRFSALEKSFAVDGESGLTAVGTLSVV